MKYKFLNDLFNKSKTLFKAFVYIDYCIRRKKLFTKTKFTLTSESDKIIMTKDSRNILVAFYKIGFWQYEYLDDTI